MLNFPRILAGFVLSILIGWVAYRRGSLSPSGWFGAVITGTLTFGFGGLSWGLTLIIFFVTSSLLSRFRQAQKERLAGEKFEKGGRRDLWQTLANGGVGALLALLYGLNGMPLPVLALFAGVMATVAADTWATELGVLNPAPPRLLTTWQIVEPGTSGAVSGYGMLATLAGALAIGLSLLLLIAAEYQQWHVWVVVAAVAGGVCGSLADSLLGGTVQALYRSPAGETERHSTHDGKPNQLVRGWRWMNNDLVNLLSSLVGGLVAWGVYSVVVG